ncbi:MAG: hypothetical protein ACR2NZ_12635 [Rubripirellula sp.]
MAIEFRCNVCDNLLEVPEGSEGKQAKCPACSKVLTVPGGDSGASVNQEPTARQNETLSSAPINPYASTAFDEPRETVPGELSVQPIDLGLALSAGWGIFKANAGLLIGALLITVVVGIGVGVMRGIVETVLEEMGNANGGLVLSVSVAFELVTQIINVWFTIGSIRIYLAVARQQPADISMLFMSGPLMVRGVICTFLFTIAVIIGLLLLIVPGIYIGVTYWSYMYFLVDRNCGILDAFGLAGRHASGNRLSALAIFLICFGLFILGVFTLCLGFLVIMPFIFAILAVAYLMMTGQRFVEPQA